MNSAVRKRPHLVNWFFIKKFAIYRKHWYEDILHGSVEKGGWVWYRFEWQHRGYIHVHGLIRMGNIPDTYELAKIAIAGHSLRHKEISACTEEDYRKFIDPGLIAEAELCRIYDSLISEDVSTADWLSPENSTPKRNVPMSQRYDDVENHELDLLDLQHIVQFHRCAPGLCLNKDNVCRHKFPKPLSDTTRCNYTRDSNSEKSIWKLKVIGKRINSTRITNHNPTQLQWWRANCDFSLLFDINKVMLYVTKYATKPEQKSGVLIKAFKDVFNDSTIGEMDTILGLRKVFTSVIGERDISVSEALHQLTGEPMFYSNLTVESVSLNSSRKLSKDGGVVKVAPSFVDMYADRKKYIKQYPGIDKLNFIDFARAYKKAPNSIVARRSSSHIVLRLSQVYSSNPNNEYYWKYCMYQLLKYKPWFDVASNALDGIENNEDGWIEAWRLFESSNNLSSAKIKWVKIMEKSEEFIRLKEEELDNNMNQEFDASSRHKKVYQESWMLNQNHIPVNDSDDEEPKLAFDIENDVESMKYWDQMRADNYSEQEVSELMTWLRDSKKANPHLEEVERIPVDVATLNDEQKFVYNIVKSFHESDEEQRQLLLRIEGDAGTGKTHLINALKDTLLEKCVLASFTGRAAVNINGVTLHSLFHFPHDSNKLVPFGETSSTLDSMQKVFKPVKYIIIDEYSMLGCRSFAMINARAKQATGKLKIAFGGLSVILVGDTKQLPPVKDCELWKPLDDDDDYSRNYAEGKHLYKLFDKVVRLTKNQRQIDTSAKGVAFREVLKNIGQCNATVKDFDILKQRMYVSPDEMELFKNAMHIYFTKMACRIRNHEKLMNERKVNGHRIARIESVSI